MSWKKHFRFVEPQIASERNAPTQHADLGSAAKYENRLPEVYAGHPQRIQRYYQYADMDKDSDINVALNLIADFCTQSEEQADEPFQIHFNGEGNETEVKLLKQCLNKWVKINNFRQKLFYIFRQAILNGDAFFLRDPQTMEWLWLDHFNIVSVRVDEEKGKVPVEYVVKGLDYARKAKFATPLTDTSTTAMGTATTAFAGRFGGSQNAGAFQLAGSHLDHSQNRPGQPGSNMDVSVIDAKHIVHLSLSIGMDQNWPFGDSVLNPIYKTYKQKEMLEDSIIIYRVQRAPERRVFKIDVGDMPPQRATAYIAKMKNEIHQRRIPNRTTNGTGSMVDSAYSPLAMMDDYFFAVPANGRGSSVETLPGGDALGEIGDLDYFTDKFARGLGIPPSYIALSKDRNPMYNDGKNGSAMVDEFRFNKQCLRWQGMLEPTFDADFKEFVERSGVNVERELYELRMSPPQNFSKYRQIDVDSQRIGLYNQIANDSRIAFRIKLRDYLGWPEDKIIENEEMWKQENPEKLKKKTGGAAMDGGGGGGGAGLDALGIRSGGMDFDDMGADADGEAMGDEGAPPADAGGADLGDAGGAAAPSSPPAPPASPA